MGTNTVKAIDDLRQEQDREFQSPKLPNLAPAFDDKFAAEIASAAIARMAGGQRQGQVGAAQATNLASHAVAGQVSQGPGPDDPRNGLHPNSALYNKLQERIPDASEDRLLQFTAACHSNRITADNLSMIHLDEANMTLGFHGTSFLSTPAFVDLNTPPPHGQAGLQQAQPQGQALGQNQAQGPQGSQQNPAQGAPQAPMF